MLVAAIFKTTTGFRHAGVVVAESGCWFMLKGGLTANSSGPAELYFESKNTSIEIWVDCISLQPFTKEEWSSRQQESIEKARKSRVKLQAIDAKGNPLANATISIQLTRPEFPFGCAINKNILNNYPYQKWFTVTTFENEMKWYSTEPEQGKEDYSVPDAMLNFTQQNRIEVHGHNVFWEDHRFQLNWLDNLSRNDFVVAVGRRIKSIMSRYSGKLLGWDVVTENLHYAYFEGKLASFFSILAYAEAAKLDRGTNLFMNEFNTLEDSRDEIATPAKFIQKMKEILHYPASENIGIPLCIGLEGHFGVPDIAYIRSALDILAQTNFPIWKSCGVHQPFISHFHISKAWLH